MRITWRSDFATTRPTERVVVAASKRQIVESPSPALDQVEQAVTLMTTLAVSELANSRLSRTTAKETSSSSYFLADLEQFEGHIRSLLLDTSLSRYQMARLNRVFGAYRRLRPIGQVRRHVEFPLLAIEEHKEFIRLELDKAVDAVITQGRKTVSTMREPGRMHYGEVCTAQKHALAVVQETRKRFRSVLTPGAFRAAQAGLLALEVACEAFQWIAYEHSEVLRADVVNQMGYPPAQWNPALLHL